MTPLEKWLSENLFQLVSIGGLGLIAIVKLQQWQSDAVKQFAAIRSDFAEHLKSSSPHSVCPTHATTLNDIASSISEIKDQIAKLDQRIYDLIRVKGGE
jgi:hypothetical protein